MIRISKGGLVLEVTSGAYKSMYKDAGWSPVGETPVEAPQEPAVGVSEAGGSNPTPEAFTASEEPQGDLKDPEASWGSGESEDETLNKMSNDELRQYASLLGIQTKDLKGRKKLMEAIKAHQK